MNESVSDPSLRDYAIQTLSSSLPRILCLLDKNPLSPSYGCLDRKYWQYKTLDFPSGMQQELVRPLAWAWAFPGTAWTGRTRLAEYARAAVRATARMAYRDGSLDDYFPRERAMGATAYALAAVLDACRLLAWKPEDATLKNMARMGDFLSAHRESGMLANHHAIAALSLLELAVLLNEPSFKRAAEAKIALLASLQHRDGWFPEYEGCDIGYQTVTLEFLARCNQRHPGSVPPDMLARLLAFLRCFAHPDGSLGGEYGSRNTYNFYPGGFALLADEYEDAAVVLGLFKHGVLGGNANYLEDDGVFGHMLSSLITMLETNCRTAPVQPEASCPHLHHFPVAELWRGGTGSLTAFGNLGKGGAYKIFREGRLLCSDTGYAGVLEDGRVFCQNVPRSSAGAMREEADGFILETCGNARQPSRRRMTPFTMLGLRGLCLVLGPFPWFSYWIRTLMQRALIYKKSITPVTFTRSWRVYSEGITVTDTIACAAPARIRTLYRTPDLIAIHVVTSDAFQKANLLDWEECTVTDGAYFCQTRFFSAGPSTSGVST